MFEYLSELSELIKDDGDFGTMMPIEDEKDTDIKDYPKNLPILALKNTVLFPGVVIPITIGRDKSIKAIKKAFSSNKIIGVV